MQSVERPAIIDELRGVLAGRPCLVLGSAPLDVPAIAARAGEVVVAVNGGIASLPGRIDIWVVNSRAAALEGWTPAKRRLHDLMAATGRGRTVGRLMLLDRFGESDAGDAMAARLLALGCRWDTRVFVPRAMRWAYECDLLGPGLSEGPSAGFLTAALCLAAGAAAVRLVGFSWHPGYAYLPREPLGAEARAHVQADQAALATLVVQYGDQVEHRLSIPAWAMARAQQRQEANMARGARAKAAAAAPVDAASGGRITVQATAVGYYGENRRRVGDVFEVAADAFAPSWMEKVDPATPLRATTPPQALAQETAALRASRAVAVGSAGPLLEGEGAPTGAADPLGTRADDD